MGVIEGTEPLGQCDTRRFEFKAHCQALPKCVSGIGGEVNGAQREMEPCEVDAKAD